MQGVSLGKQGCGREGLGVKKIFTLVEEGETGLFKGTSQQVQGPALLVALGSSVGGVRKLIRCGGLSGVGAGARASC